jgi:hypothetical protein
MNIRWYQHSEQGSIPRALSLPSVATEAVSQQPNSRYHPSRLFCLLDISFCLLELFIFIWCSVKDSMTNQSFGIVAGWLWWLRLWQMTEVDQWK